jgi:hypothetical protein
VITPCKGRSKPALQKAANRAHAKLCGPGERANAQLKTWRILGKLRCCPWARRAARQGHPRASNPRDAWMDKPSAAACGRQGEPRHDCRDRPVQAAAPIGLAAGAVHLRGIAPGFRAVPGLIGKRFIYAGDGWARGVCLGQTGAAAGAFYAGPWPDGVRQRYGMGPQVKFFQRACITGKATGVVLLPDTAGSERWEPTWSAAARSSSSQDQDEEGSVGRLGYERVAAAGAIRPQCCCQRSRPSDQGREK